MASVQERYQLLMDDPDLSKVEAHRVYCNRCNKWLKLDETKLYAASVWRCHKNTKSHNAKAPVLSASAPPPVSDLEASGSSSNPKPSASSAAIPSKKEEDKQVSSSRPSLRRRVSADRPKPTSTSSPSSGAQQKIPRLKIRVPAPSRGDGAAPSAAPSSAGASTTSQPSAAKKSKDGDPSQGTTLPSKKPQPSGTLSQVLSSSQLSSTKTDSSLTMPPPVSPSSKRKAAVTPAVNSASTSQGTPANQAAVSKPSSSPSDSRSGSSKEKDTSTTGAPVPHFPLPPGLLPDRQASYCALKAEPHIQALEPYRAFCSLCGCWIELSSRTQYSYGVWKGHVRKSDKHTRLQVGHAENDYETASEHSQDEPGACSTSENVNVAASSNGVNGDAAAPSSSVPHTDSVVGAAGQSATVQEADGKGTGAVGNPPHPPADPPPSATPNGASSSAPLGNPFALKATTEDSFGPRHKKAKGDTVESEIGLLEGDMPILTESSDEEPNTNSPQRKLSAAKARQKRRAAMLADPDAAVVESRRVQCRMCERWIKGSNTQEYSSHHWLKHKNKCARTLARENDRWSETAETRKQKMEADPDLEMLEAHRALCKLCHKWVKLCSRSRFSASHWLQHKKKCPALHGPESPIGPGDFADSVDGPAAAESDGDEKMPFWDPEARRAEFLTDPDVLQLRPDRVQCRNCYRWIKLSSSLQYKNVNWLLHKECCCPGNSADSTGKQHNALEERRKVLEDDADVAEFEPHRVRCAVCKSWVKLRHDCSYSLGKWLLHRRRCGVKTRELLKSQSVHSGDGGTPPKAESCADDDEDDAREAMDVENWLKDETDEAGDPSPPSDDLSQAGCSCNHKPKRGHVHTVGNVDVDEDVDMDGTGGQLTSNQPLTSVGEADGKDAGGSGQTMSMQPPAGPSANLQSEPGMPQRDALRSGRVVGHHTQVQASRRRGRGKVVSRPIRPLPKGKAKAAPFMRAQSSGTLPPIPLRPRWPDEDERKQQFVSDPDVLRVEPHRLLCKTCNCWIRLHPIIRYCQSIWPRHKESCKGMNVLISGDARSRARSEKEDARQRILDDDPYATDVSPHRVTCKACGTSIRLDTTYKYEGSHWRAHRSRCVRIPVHARVSKKRKAIEPIPEAVVVINSSDSDDSDASSAPRPRPTSFFTAPLIIKPTEMFKRRSVSSASKVVVIAATKARKEVELATELKNVAARLEEDDRYMTILQSCGDGITSEERLAQHIDGQAKDAGKDSSQDDDGRGTLRRSPTPDSDSWVPRKRTREEIEEFDAFFRSHPMPPSPPLARPKNKVRTCKLGKDAMQVLD